MSNVTGGSIPTTVWHSFMSVAHGNMQIRDIPGLPPHPQQVAERQRLEELKRTQPQLARQLAEASDPRRASLMTEQAREALKRVARSMRLAASGQTEPAPASTGQPAVREQPAAQPPARAPAAPPAEPAQRGRRADTAPAGDRTNPPAGGSTRPAATNPAPRNAAAADPAAGIR
jgi:penicillin-binding protein 1A